MWDRSHFDSGHFHFRHLKHKNDLKNFFVTSGFHIVHEMRIVMYQKNCVWFSRWFWISKIMVVVVLCSQCGWWNMTEGSGNGNSMDIGTPMCNLCIFTFRLFLHSFLPFVLLPDVGTEGLSIFGLEVTIFGGRTAKHLVLTLPVFLVPMQVKLKYNKHQTSDSSIGFFTVQVDLVFLSANFVYLRLQIDHFSGTYPPL